MKYNKNVWGIENKIAYCFTVTCYIHSRDNEYSLSQILIMTSAKGQFVILIGEVLKKLALFVKKPINKFLTNI